MIENMSNDEIMETYFPYKIIPNCISQVPSFDEALKKIFETFNWEEECFLLNKISIRYWTFKESEWIYKCDLLDKPELISKINFVVSLRYPEFFRFKTEYHATLAKIFL
jgi:hypothetical protein